MYQTISESISVLGVFQNFKFIPKKFKWNHNTFTVDKITGIHQLKDGNVQKRRYSVMSAGNLYLIEYNLKNESWELIQIWYEG